MCVYTYTYISHSYRWIPTTTSVFVVSQWDCLFIVRRNKETDECKTFYWKWHSMNQIQQTMHRSRARRFEILKFPLLRFIFLWRPHFSTLYTKNRRLLDLDLSYGQKIIWHFSYYNLKWFIYKCACLTDTREFLMACKSFLRLTLISGGWVISVVLWYNAREVNFSFFFFIVISCWRKF